jgi:hypothetical protein
VRYLRQSTQGTIVLGPLTSNADYVTPTTVTSGAAGIDVDVYKVGAKSDVTLAGSAGDGYWIHVANGYHALTLSTGHTDTVGRLKATFNATGVLPFFADYTVLPAVIYDAFIAGTDEFPADVTKWLGATAGTAVNTNASGQVTPTDASKTGYSGVATNMIAAPSGWATPENVTSATSGIPAATAALIPTPSGWAVAGDEMTLPSGWGTPTDIAAGFTSVLTATSGVAKEANATANKLAIIEAIPDADVPGDVILTKLTTNTSGAAIGITTPGANVTAYLRADTARAVPKRHTVAETDGDWTLPVAPHASYTLVFAKDGYDDAGLKADHTEEVDVP